MFRVACARIFILMEVYKIIMEKFVFVFLFFNYFVLFLPFPFPFLCTFHWENNKF